MLDAPFVHTGNITVSSQRCPFGKYHVSHLAAWVFDDDKLFGVPVGQGLDFVSHVEMLGKEVADCCYLIGRLAVELNFFSSLCLVKHINSIVDILLDNVHQARVFPKFP